LRILANLQKKYNRSEGNGVVMDPLCLWEILWFSSLLSASQRRLKDKI